MTGNIWIDLLMSLPEIEAEISDTPDELPAYLPWVMQRANAGLRERFELMERYLGPINRAGEGFQPPDKANREEKVYRAAGFYGPQRIEVPRHRRAHQRSDRGRHLLALQFDSPLIREPREAFEADPRRLLHDANPAGIFSEQMREVAADIWRPGSPAPTA